MLHSANRLHVSIKCENRVALISPSDVGQYDRPSNLRAGLSNRGFKVGVFVETKAAADWLAER